MLSDKIDWWLQDDVNWTPDGVDGRIEWVEYNQSARTINVMPDGSRVETLLERGIHPDTCNTEVPDRAHERGYGDFWRSFRCGLPSGHDCPHVAVGASVHAYRISSLLIRRPTKAMA